MPRYEYSSGSSHKFWTIELRGSDIELRWGRIGSEGQSKRKSFDSPVEARDEYRKAVAAKEAKGYRLTEGDPENRSAAIETDELNDAKTALLSFVNDLAGGEQEILDNVRALIATPPRATAEEMGFYPRGDQDEFERTFLKTVRTLDEFGYLRSWEDKYVAYMLHEWITSGFVPAGGLSPQTVFYAEKLKSPTSKLGVGVSPRDLPADEARELAEQFDNAAADVEAAVENAGQSLLSIDLSGGDHLYAFLMPSALADKWRDVLFWKRANADPLAVRGFMWAQFAEFLKYANGMELHCITGKRANQPLRAIADEHVSSAVPETEDGPQPRRVRHPKFGDGLVLRETDSGAARKLEIQFADETRTILARFTEPLD